MFQRTSLFGSVLAVMGLFATTSGCDGGGEGAAGGGGTSDVVGPTYYANVKPVVDGRCANCHVEGGIAPFPLTTYEEVLEHKGAIKVAVETGTMPPWKADSDCNDYKNDRSLTDDQIQMIVDWADAGGPEGDAANEGEPLDLTGMPKLSRVDLEVGMADEYTMVETPDEYRCFVLDWPEDARRYVTGMGVRPGNAAVVHHVIAFLAGPDQIADVEALDEADPSPGYTCFGGPGFSGGGWLGAWAPGNSGSDYPDGTGIPVEPGSKIVMQVHYNALTAGMLPDLTTIQMKIDDEVEREAAIQPWTNPLWVYGTGMDIPAATHDVTHSWDQAPTPYLSDDGPLIIHSPSLHMHQLGQSAKLSVIHEDGSETCLLHIPAWDFHWQGAYPLVEPFAVQPGDKLHLECTWDNPTMQNVKWGEGTGDEMCLGSFYYTLP